MFSNIFYGNSDHIFYIFKEYTYKIPHADEPGYWTEIDKDPAGRPRRIAWNRNFYVFGEFLNGPANYEKEPTVITGMNSPFICSSVLH
jgi:hypothetical protein